jgi:hypothetical protein
LFFCINRTAVAGAVGKVRNPAFLRDFQAQWESPLFGLFQGAAFSIAHLPTNCAIEPKRDCPKKNGEIPDDGTEIIPGHEGHSHIFEYDSDFLGVLIMPNTGTAHRWNAARSTFIAAGMEIRQNGDSEGTASFDPNNSDQVRLALRYAKIRSKRKISESQKQRLREVGFKRSSVSAHTVERELAP